MKIHEALTEVMRSVPAVPKADRNTAQGFDFRGVDAVVNALGPAMRKHGVVVAPSLVKHEIGTATVGRNGSLMQTVLVVVSYRFYGPEGDCVVVETPGYSMDSGDKAMAKAMSVAYRTALLQTFVLPTDERDPDHDVYDRKEPLPATYTPAAQARAELGRKMQELGLTRQQIVDKYAVYSEVPLGEEDDAERIKRFTMSLRAGS